MQAAKNVSAEESALIELERRRAKNALAQKRFRQRRKQAKEVAETQVAWAQPQTNVFPEADLDQWIHNVSQNLQTETIQPSLLQQQPFSQLSFDPSFVFNTSLPGESFFSSETSDTSASTTPEGNLAAVKRYTTTNETCRLIRRTFYNQSTIKSLHFTTLLPDDIPSRFLFQVFVKAAIQMGFTAEMLDSKRFVSPVRASWYAHIMQKGLPGRAPIRSYSKEEGLLDYSAVPENMHPTPLQLAVDHHPYVDILFPWPAMRERHLFFLEQGVIDEDAMCTLFSNHPSLNGKPVPIYVWSDDMMDPDSYEFTPEFIDKFPMLFDAEIIRRTNWWRRRRGLQEYHLPIMT